MSDTAQPSSRDKMMKILGKFPGSRFVRTIMGAGYSIITFSIIGLMFLVPTVLTQVVTVRGFINFYNNISGCFDDIYAAIYNATIGTIIIYLAGPFAYNYTDIYHKGENLLFDSLNAVFLILMGLLITVPQLAWKDDNTVFVSILKKNNVIVGSYDVSGFGLTRIDVTGIFTGLIVAQLTVRVYRFRIKHDWRIKMPTSVPSDVASPFTVSVPGFVIAIVTALIDAILIVLGADIFQLLFIPFLLVPNIASAWWGVLVIFFLIHFLWWSGIHGAAIISSFYQAIVLSNMAANALGACYIFAGGFTDAPVVMGGSGATLGMTLWTASAFRSKQLRELGELETVPVVFNIGESPLFSLPVIYSVRLPVSLLLASITCSMAAYTAVAAHLAPKAIVQQPWPIPVGIGGMMATTSWQGAVLALVNVAAVFLIWYPFIRHYDNELLKKKQVGTERV